MSIHAAPKNTANENKANLDLIPWGLIAKHLPQAFEEGLIKYYKRSWELGFTTTSMFAGTMRHLIAYRDGENYDPSAAELGVKKHHLAGALFCILCLLDTFDNHPELDDRGKDCKPEDWSTEKMKKQIQDFKKVINEKEYPWVMLYLMPNGQVTYSKKFKRKEDVIAEKWLEPWEPIKIIQLKPQSTN